MVVDKIFLNIANNRDHIINYCNRPFNKFDRLCRDWYLSYNSDDNEIRVLYDNLTNKYMLMWQFWFCYHINGCKSKKYFEKMRHVKNNDKFKKYILRGERNTRYHDRILSNKNGSFNMT